MTFAALFYADANQNHEHDKSDHALFFRGKDEEVQRRGLTWVEW